VRLVATQWAWALGITALALATWRRGIRRYEAYGA